MMSYRLTLHDGFALAQIEGLVSLESWGVVLAGVSAAARASGAGRRIVLDMTAVVGYLGIPERQQVGALMARHLNGTEKMAIVVQAHKITTVVSTEARRNGLNLQLFPLYDDAVAWATSDR